MSTPLLATKLYVPPLRPNVGLRPRLTQRLNEGLLRKLTLLSAPAGFGKTALISEWLASLSPEVFQPGPSHRSQPTPQTFNVAWLSLDAAVGGRPNQQLTSVDLY